MSRLTQKDEHGNWCLKGMAWNDFHIGRTITEEMYDLLYGALWKLMDYEDTGLSPDEVERVNDFERSQAGKLLKKLNEEQRKHQWVPAEDRPEKTGGYICTLAGGIIGGDKPFVGMSWYENGEWDDQESVLAWMPLPDAYKPE